MLLPSLATSHPSSAKIPELCTRLSADTPLKCDGRGLTGESTLRKYGQSNRRPLAYASPMTGNSNPRQSLPSGKRSPPSVSRPPMSIAYSLMSGRPTLLREQRPSSRSSPTFPTSRARKTLPAARTSLMRMPKTRRRSSKPSEILQRRKSLLIPSGTSCCIIWVSGPRQMSFNGHMKMQMASR